jgi:arginyl-tRNA synthetase
VHSVFANAAERGIAARSRTRPALTLDNPEDLGLLLQIEQFPDVEGTAAATYAPHLVSYYCVTWPEAAFLLRHAPGAASGTRP